MKRGTVDKAQSDRFIEAARELGCNEDEALFDEKLRKLRTPAAIRAELAAAEKALERLREKWDNYDGNNPNKYRSSIKQAELTVSILKGELEAAERKG